LKLATLLAAVTVGFAFASFGQGVVVFDNVTNFETGVPGATNVLTGSTPNSFMGDGYLLTPGTTNITGFDVFPANLTGTDFSGGLQINIYVWGSVNLGAVNSTTPAFSNLLAVLTTYSFSDFPSGFAFSLEGSPRGSAPGFVLAQPLAIPGTNVGITFNYQGSTDGINFASFDNLYSLISYGTPADVGGQDFNGYFRNVSSEMTGNFNEGIRSLGLTNQTLALRIFGTVAPLGPVANSQSVNVLKNTSANITLTGSVPAGDPTNYAIVNSPTNGTLSGSPPNVIYTPNANYVGPDAFTFKVNDGITDSVPALVSLNVSALAGLVIIPTWDSTILSDPNVASITNTIINTILTYETRFSDPVTVNITFAEMNTGLGMSSTPIDSVNYSDYYNALVANAKTTNDTVVLAHLPGGATDPVTGGTSIFATPVNFRALGFIAPASPDGIISVNMNLINITRPPAVSTNYDLQSVVSHEIDEVLGTISNVGQTGVRPADLFRFSGPGARNFTTSGDSAFFSIDGGTNLLVQYNQDSRGDYGDWWSIGAHTPRVQDAFGTPGATPDLGVELTVLDSVGYTLVSAIPLVVPQPIVHVSRSGTNLVLTWNSTINAKYQVQYTTNLFHTNWVSLGGPITALGTTTTNTDTSLTDKQRFYRVQVLPSSSVVLAPAAKTTTQKTAVKGPIGFYRHVTHPRYESKTGSPHVVAPRQRPLPAIPAARQTFDFSP
jgi:hypothetical protein